MSDDQWAHLDKVDVTDAEIDAMYAAEPPDLTDPGGAAITFIAGLERREENLTALRLLVTPESLDAWGDFTAAEQMLHSIDDWGVGSVPKPAVDNPDVVYASVLRGVSKTFQVRGEDQIVAAAAVVTMVWRPEHRRWMVHAFGDYFPAELVPRG